MRSILQQALFGSQCLLRLPLHSRQRGSEREPSAHISGTQFVEPSIDAGAMRTLVAMSNVKIKNLIRHYVNQANDDPAAKGARIGFGRIF